MRGRYDRTIAEIRANADHLKALGDTGIHVFSDMVNFPYELVTEVRPGGSHRIDISTSVWFKAPLPEGITLEGGFDIEHREANGKGYYSLDTEGIASVLIRLSPKGRTEFSRYLLDCAEKVDEKGKEYLSLAQRQMGDAAVLRTLAQTEQP